MAASYHRLGRNDPAVFELFVRKLPPHRDWLVVCGLGPTLRLITEMRFGPAELEYLGTLGCNDDFLRYLEGFRFSGDIEAMPEGTIAFPDEPLVRVTAPLIDAQLLETLLLNQINFQTMIATKAARIVLAARRQGRVRDRLLAQAGPRGRRGDEGRPGIRGRRIRRDLERGGRDALRPDAGRARWRTPTCSASRARRRPSRRSCAGTRGTRCSSSTPTTLSRGSAGRSRLHAAPRSR